MGISSSGPAGGGSAGSELLWTWDGTLDQFTNGATPELTTSTGAALSVATGPDGQPTLRATAGSGTGYSQWCIDPAQFTTLPERYILEISSVRSEDGAGGRSIASRVGFSHFCEYVSAGDVNAYSLCQYGNLNSYLQLWTRGTTFAAAGTTPDAIGPGTALDIQTYHQHVEARHVNVGAGTYDFHYSILGYGNGLTTVRKDIEADAATLDLDAGAYDGVTPNTFGLAADWQGANHFVEYQYIRILKHPADVTL